MICAHLRHCLKDTQYAEYKYKQNPSKALATRLDFHNVFPIRPKWILMNVKHLYAATVYKYMQL